MRAALIVAQQQRTHIQIIVHGLSAPLRGRGRIAARDHVGDFRAFLVQFQDQKSRGLRHLGAIENPFAMRWFLHGDPGIGNGRGLGYRKLLAVERCQFLSGLLQQAQGLVLLSGYVHFLALLM